MYFTILTDTAGARIGELASELRNYLEPKIKINIQILILKFWLAGAVYQNITKENHLSGLKKKLIV
ncbi:hypothetical protein [Anaerocolumna jejuensis]|uniref:hypothetical protein n=1 Tax=Anaerocolumna jejuensis TaxID=259063 RepID=UPI003F7CA7C2